MDFKPSQAPAAPDHFARNENGQMTVSWNNKHQDIAFYFDHKEIIRTDLELWVKSSNLSNEAKQFLDQAISKELVKIQEEACSLARSDRDKHQIRFSLIEGLRRAVENVLGVDDKRELLEVLKAINGAIFAMTEGDRVFDYLTSRK